MKFYESKTAKFLAGKGFYGVLAVCMAAVAIATYSAIKTGENVAVPQDTNQSQTSGNGSVSEITLPSVPSEDTLINQQSSVPDTTEVGNEGDATYFSLPIDGEIIKGYSDSVLQYSSTFNDMRIHTGMDILGESGARVSACAQGVVCGIEENTVYGVNTVGLRRAGFDEKRRFNIKKAVKTYFFRHLNSRQAVAQLNEDFAGDADIAEFIEFVSTSKRGILQGKAELNAITAESSKEE
jgi:hypothetical protein